MTPAEALRAARELLSDKDRWTKRQYWGFDYPDPVEDLNRLRYCAIGALNHAEEEFCSCPLHDASRRDADYEIWKFLPIDAIPSFYVSQRVSGTLLSKAAMDLYGLPITAVNDNLGHEAVLHIYDVAIKYAEMES